MFLGQETLKSLVWNHRDKQHLKVLQGQLCAVFAVRVEQTTKVELACGCSVLKQHHDAETDQVSQYDDPVNNFESRFVQINQIFIAQLVVVVLTLDDEVIHVYSVLYDRKSHPCKDKANTLLPEEGIIIHVPYHPHHTHHTKQCNVVDYVKADRVDDKESGERMPWL